MKITETLKDTNNQTINPTKNSFKETKIEVFERRIFLKIPKNETDIAFIRKIQFVHWDKNWFHWVIPNYPGNLTLLKTYFDGRIDSLIEHQSEVLEIKEIDGEIIKKREDVLLIKTKNNRLRIIFGFNQKLLQTIKKIPYHTWDGKNKWWSIPYSDIFKDIIYKQINELGLSIIFKEEVDEKSSLTIHKRITPFDISNYKTCPDDFILKLKELRYSLNTEKTYKFALEDYLNYHHTIDIEKLNEGHIQSFLRHLVMERNVSTSYQNQAINAIKFYYERVLGGQRKTYFIDRPKKEKTLPVVLSEEEILLILRSVSNLKHKAILMVIYSAGLRISECINLKIKDIDSNRMQIRVEQSKGKKDRYTLLSTKTLLILRDYFKEYRPKEFLFEGQDGGCYSSRSIQNIFRDAVEKTKIKKKVSVHSLRHSFATHLLENGTNLRYIQSLLGHSNSKTTEIYTHITTKGFEQLKSPLDNLDI
jgi:integrase/recombinase XerD